VLSGRLQKIWKCAPKALVGRDMDTGLYPFMLAASVTYNYCLIGNDIYAQFKLSQFQIDTTYGILWTCPQVMDMILAAESNTKKIPGQYMVEYTVVNGNDGIPLVMMYANTKARAVVELVRPIQLTEDLGAKKKLSLVLSLREYSSTTHGIILTKVTYHLI